MKENHLATVAHIRQLSLPLARVQASELVNLAIIALMALRKRVLLADMAPTIR